MLKPPKNQFEDYNEKDFIQDDVDKINAIIKELKPHCVKVVKTRLGYRGFINLCRKYAKKNLIEKVRLDIRSGPVKYGEQKHIVYFILREGKRIKPPKNQFEKDCFKIIIQGCELLKKIGDHKNYVNKIKLLSDKTTNNKLVFKIKKNEEYLKKLEIVETNLEKLTKENNQALNDLKKETINLRKELNNYLETLST